MNKIRDSNCNNDDDDSDDYMSSTNLSDTACLTQEDNSEHHVVTPQLAYASAGINRKRKDEIDSLEIDALTSNFRDILPLTKDFDIYSDEPSAEVDTLTDEQRRAIDMICSGENVYIYGKPGTGKSYLLLKLKSILHKNKKTYQYLAPTGIAAENIGLTKSSIYY